MSESAYSLDNVEIFTSGMQRGKEYSDADLQQIVENFDQFSGPDAPKILLHVPAVIGHEEDQEYLKNTGLPAAGWVSALRCETKPPAPDGLASVAQEILKTGGADADLKGMAQEVLDNPQAAGQVAGPLHDRLLDLKLDDLAGQLAPKACLYADFLEVPPQVARLLKSKAYRTVSAEIYDEPPPGVPGRGKMLRRVAFLGAEIPQVKGLDDIPAPRAYSESSAPYAAVVLRYRERKATALPGCYACFCEAQPEAFAEKTVKVKAHTRVIRDRVEKEAERKPPAVRRRPRLGETVNQTRGAYPRTVVDEDPLGAGQDAVTVRVRRSDGMTNLALDAANKDDSGQSYGDQPPPARLGPKKGDTPFAEGDVPMAGAARARLAGRTPPLTNGVNKQYVNEVNAVAAGRRSGVGSTGGPRLPQAATWTGDFAAPEDGPSPTTAQIDGSKPYDWHDFAEASPEDARALLKSGNLTREQRRQVAQRAYPDPHPLKLAEDDAESPGGTPSPHPAVATSSVPRTPRRGDHVVTPAGHRRRVSATGPGYAATADEEGRSNESHDPRALTNAKSGEPFDHAEGDEAEFIPDPEPPAFRPGDVVRINQPQTPQHGRLATYDLDGRDGQHFLSLHPQGGDRGGEHVVWNPQHLDLVSRGGFAPRGSGEQQLPIGSLPLRPNYHRQWDRGFKRASQDMGHGVYRSDSIQDLENRAELEAARKAGDREVKRATRRGNRIEQARAVNKNDEGATVNLRRPAPPPTSDVQPTASPAPGSTEQRTPQPTRPGATAAPKPWQHLVDSRGAAGQAQGQGWEQSAAHLHGDEATQEEMDRLEYGANRHRQHNVAPAAPMRERASKNAEARPQPGQRVATEEGQTGTAAGRLEIPSPGGHPNQLNRVEVAGAAPVYRPDRRLKDDKGKRFTGTQNAEGRLRDPRPAAYHQSNDTPEPHEHGETAPTEDLTQMREQHCRKLAEAGMSPDTIDEMPDHHLEQIAELIAALQGQKGEGDKDPDDPNDPAKKDENAPPSPMESDDENQWPKPANDQDKQQFRERAKKYAERLRKFSAMYGEGCDPDDKDPDGKDKKKNAIGKDTLGLVSKMSEQQLRSLIATTVAQAVKGGAEQGVALIEKFSEDQVRSSREKTIEAILDEAARDGKLPPSRREKARTSLETAARAAAAGIVVKFSEGGKQRDVNPWDHEVARVREGYGHFGEKIPASRIAAGSDDAEVDNLKALWEAGAATYAGGLQKFSEVLPFEEQRQAFLSKRKTNPALTAQQYFDQARAR